MSRKKEIRLANLFSGIGAIEQAFIKMNLPHKIVFACDNGEIELIPLFANDQKDFLKLKKNEKSLQGDEKTRYENLKNAELKKRCLALEESLKETKKDLLTAITKWDEAVNKLHNDQMEFYAYKRSAIEESSK